MDSSAPLPWRNPRKHPRVRLVTQVESHTSHQVSLGRVENVSIGGMLILSRETFERGTEVTVRFNLPDGKHVEAQARIAHTKPGEQMGVQFVDISDEARRSIAGFVQEVKPYTRRSVRLARRVSLVVYWKDFDGEEHIEAVETRMLSQHGGMLLAHTPFKPGTDILIQYPEKNKEARARVVHRTLGATGDLAQVGFEFREAGNFWEVEFPPDPNLWEPI